MRRRHVLILLAAAVLLTAFSAALSRRDSRDWRANRSRRLLPFPWQDAAAVDVLRPGGGPVSLRRRDDGRWEVRTGEDMRDLVNPTVLEEISALATLTWREPVPGRAAPPPGDAPTLTITSVSGQTVAFAFGGIDNSLRAVTIDGDDSVVYGVNQDFLGFLDWPRDRFRNTLLFDQTDGRAPDAVVLAPDAADPSLTVRLERTDDGWRVREPVDWPADATRIDMLLGWLGRIRTESIAAEMTGDLAWFGFAPPRGYIETVRNRPDGTALRTRVEIGKEEGGVINVRDTSRLPVFTIPRDVMAELSMDSAARHPVEWRNFYRRRALNLVENTVPDTVVIERLLPEPETLTLRRTVGADGLNWTGVLADSAGERAFAVDPPDAEEAMRPLTALFTGLANIRVKAFLADQAPGPDTVAWTAFPAWRITLSSAGAALPALTLYAANARGDLPSGQPYAGGSASPAELTALDGYPDKAGFAVSLDGTPAVLETFAEMSYLLALPPYRYQSRRLLNVPARHFRKIVVKDNAAETTYFRRDDEVNEQWWRTPEAPEPLMDDNNRFVAAMLELSQLRAEGFVAAANGDVAEFGLDRPDITAIVYGSPESAEPESGEGKLFTLSVGGVADAAGNRYARLDAAGPVFLISRELAGKLAEDFR